MYKRQNADGADLPAVPGNFAHMQLVAENGPAQVRFRLKATIDQDDDIEESFTYVISEDADGTPVEESRVSKQDRGAIQVHYLPARRDPADHIAYSANALLGRALRSADWSAEREEIGTAVHKRQVLNWRSIQAILSLAMGLGFPSGST